MNLQERTEMMTRMLALQAEIAAEIEKPTLDPGRLMRLTAAGMNQCIVALTVLMTDSVNAANR